MGIGRSIVEIQDKIEYNFKDITLLQTALTHTSYTNEMKVKGYRAESNELLEFLGDAVLQIIISEELYDGYRKMGEGMLTKMRQRLVCEETLARLAEKLELGLYMNIGAGEEAIGLRQKPKALADALEALVGAVYIDDRENGHGTAFRRVIIGLYGEEIQVRIREGDKDYKSMLQKFVEKNPDTILKYQITERGPEHSKEFDAIAYVNNNKVGEGCGKTKRSAEMEAARNALALFGII